MNTYRIVEAGHDTAQPVEAADVDEALTLAIAAFDGDNYRGEDYPDHRTQWVTVLVVDDETGDCASKKVTVEPVEPPCTGVAHDWVDGPPRSSGGGVTYDDTCSRCSLVRRTDTWAQDPADGTEGLYSTAYLSSEG